MKKLILLIVAVAVVLLFAYFVWPTPYGTSITRKDRYTTITKTNRFNGSRSTTEIEEVSGKETTCPPEMVYIPSGEFTIGCSAEDSECEDDETSSMQVSIDGDLCMDKTEVTNEDYGKCVMAEKCSSQWSGQCYMLDGSNWVQKSSASLDITFKRNAKPVVCVSWEDAKKYCSWAGKYLPAEAEWEYAARGGTTTKYYWGSSMDGSYAWYWDNSNMATHQVGQTNENAYGLYDMLGNVWEWVEDCYVPDWGQEMSGLNPLIKWRDCGEHVLRGGSWYDEARELRVSNRDSLSPSSEINNLRFRCAKRID